MTGASKTMQTITLNKLIFPFLILLLLGHMPAWCIFLPKSDSIDGSVYYLSLNGVTRSYDKFAKFRIRIPDNIKVIKGATLYMGHNSLDAVYDEDKWQSAKALGFAVIGSYICCDFKYIEPATNAKEAVLAALDTFSRESAHPELKNIALYPTGFSEGSKAAFSINCSLANQIMGFYAASATAGSSCNDQSHSAPGMIVWGEKEKTQDPNWLNHRKRGALWGMAIQWGAGHNWYENFRLQYAFLANSAKHRIPLDADPLKGPIKLNTLSEEKGWLGDPASWNSDEPKVASYADYTGDKRAAAWFPDEYMARVWQAFVAKTHPVPLLVNGKGGVVLVEPGDKIDLISFPRDESFSKVEFYNGDKLLGSSVAYPFELKGITLEQGLYSLIAKGIKKAGGNAYSWPVPVVIKAKSDVAAIRTVTRRGIETNESQRNNWIMNPFILFGDEKVDARGKRGD